MNFRNGIIAEGSIKYALKDTEDTLKGIFSNINLEDKYFLFIRTRMYYPYIVNKIDCTIKLFDEDNNLIKKNDKYKIRTPYPNQCLHLNSMKYGRKLCNDGYVLMFDTFEELKKIVKVKIDWSINSNYENGEKFELNSTIIYHTNFIEKENNNVFSITSNDSFGASYDDPAKATKYEEQFDENKYIVTKPNVQLDMSLCNEWDSEELKLLVKERIEKEVDCETIFEIHIQKLNLEADNTRIEMIG